MRINGDERPYRAMLLGAQEILRRCSSEARTPSGWTNSAAPAIAHEFEVIAVRKAAIVERYNGGQMIGPTPHATRVIDISANDRAIPETPELRSAAPHHELGLRPVRWHEGTPPAQRRLNSS